MSAYTLKLHCNIIGHRENKIVGIIGYGQFGRFWADVLRTDYRVIVTDTASPSDDITFHSLPELCQQADHIFLCVPINQIETVVREIQPLLRPETVVLEGASNKRSVTGSLHPGIDIPLVILVECP